MREPRSATAARAIATLESRRRGSIRDHGAWRGLERILLPPKDMETRQRHAEPYISPWTDRWPKKRQLGFGGVALIPLTLLATTFLVWFLSAAGIGMPVTYDLLPLLFYTHVGAQFITLLVFGHLMVANPLISGATKLVWGAAFLFFAPFAIPTYWALHVWREEETDPSEMQQRRPAREVHVYDYDYETHGHGIEQRDDGSIVHRIDAS